VEGVNDESDNSEEDSYFWVTLEFPREPISLLKMWCKAFVFAENNFFQLHLVKYHWDLKIFVQMSTISLDSTTIITFIKTMIIFCIKE
jgi:hypothetical protein